MSEWLDPELGTDYPEEEKVKSSSIKNPEIQKLTSYEEIPEDSFWDIFPFFDMPKHAETSVNIVALEDKIDSVRSQMTETEIRRAAKVVKDLKEGASAYQKSDLPPLKTANARSTYENGEMLTDTIATWVKCGFVAGPFDSPPMPGFRANPLAAVVRNGKTRPILNMSGPKGRSFNDNVDRSKVDKLFMGTPKQFSHALRDAGEGAVFSKFDIKDAYKLVPAKTEDYKLQGFCWLGKYFVETRLAFGGVPSPINFDRLGKTKDLVVCLRSGTPRKNVFRALDDSPCVAPKNSGITEAFSKEMRELCRDVNIPLADNCPLREKAFEMTTKGTVLGVGFDSLTMKWFYSEEKADRVKRRCLDARRSQHLDLKQVQKLMGSINDLAQMCPLIKFHKRSGNVLLTRFGGNENILLRVHQELKEDLLFIAKVAESSKAGLPVADPDGMPTLAALTFYTDAAGASFSMRNGDRVFHNNKGKGVACVAGTELNDVWGWTRISWPDQLLTDQKDEKGRSFGCKSTTLESVGILLPLLAFPEKVKGRNLIFKIDNIAVMFGWQHGYVKNDATASEILKSAQYL